MSRTLGSPRHRALVELVIKERKSAGLTQVQVAKKLRRYQSYVTLLETGQRRLDVVEFMDIADAIGLDASAAIKRLYKIPKKNRYSWRPQPEAAYDRVVSFDQEAPHTIRLQH